MSIIGQGRVNLIAFIINYSAQFRMTLLEAVVKIASESKGLSYVHCPDAIKTTGHGLKYMAGIHIRS